MGRSAAILNRVGMVGLRVISFGPRLEKKTCNVSITGKDVPGKKKGPCKRGRLSGMLGNHVNVAGIE